MNFSSYENLREILESVKSYIDQHTPDNVVYSVSLNNGSVIKPDTNGNVDLTVPMPDLSSYVKTSDKFWLINIYGKENWTFGQLMGDSQADPLATKSYVDAKVPNLTGIIKTVSVNKGAQVGPDTNGNADLTINTYTLELDGGSGANITASIDNGDPVSKDSNNNINLNVPDKYIDTVAGWGRVFDNENTPMYNEDGDAIPHTINMGYIGKPKYYVSIRSTPSFSYQIPSYFYVEVPSDGIIELYGLDNEYIKISHRQLIEVKGDVWILKQRLGNFSEGFFVGVAKGNMTMNILSLGSLSYIKVCTGVETTEYSSMSPIFERFNYKTWETNITAKGFTRQELLNLKDTSGNEFVWMYKPTQYHPDSRDKNTIHPDMVFEVGDAESINEQYGIKYMYINHVPNENLYAGQWVFRNKYVGGMGGNDYVYRMPYYDTQGTYDGQWILLDFVMGNSTKTRVTKDYHCTITDWNLNPLVDVTMHPFSGTTMDFTLEQHIYYRIRYHKEKKFWEVTRAVDF